MSIKYRLYQETRKASKRKGWWYARAVAPDTVTLRDLSQRISEMCTVTEPDILAVLSALVTQMNLALRDGNKVRLDGLGTFKVGIHSRGAETLDEFNVMSHIYRPHVIFNPAVTVDAMRRRVKNLLSGIRLQEAMDYTAPEMPEGEGGRRRKKVEKVDKATETEGVGTDAGSTAEDDGGPTVHTEETTSSTEAQ